VTAAPAKTRIAIGVPVLNGASHLAEALDSFLEQSYPDFLLLVHDNHSSDATPEICASYAAADGRVHYRRGDATVGMIENWRRTYWSAVEEFGRFEYFAFGSDHDYWHPLWLERMVTVLDRDPGVVLAFSLIGKMHQDGTRFEGEARRWDTSRLDDPADRVAAVVLGVRPKPLNVTHGLMRAEALERCGVMPSVLLPDRALMNRLAAIGKFEQVPELLWVRRYWDTPRVDQRKRLFTRGVPLSTRLPRPLVQVLDFFRWAVVGPGIGRRQGVRMVATVLARRRSVLRKRKQLKHFRNAAVAFVRVRARRLGKPGSS
jgi:glycosyltransferase involved in cell wall biosynthesis